jgi:hypothetical protein
MQMTDLVLAYDFCTELHSRLVAALSDVGRVRQKVAQLKSHASFQETRFCKGCFLPVLDEFANEFFSDRYGASATDVRAALRCEGYRTLKSCYEMTGRLTYFSGTPITKARQPVGKNGQVPGGQACPDFCIRLAGSVSPFRMMGEAKYSATGAKECDALKDLHRHVKYYLAIKSDPLTDWGHDFGYGIGYAAGGGGTRESKLIEDHWDSDRILISAFWSPG